MARDYCTTCNLTSVYNEENKSTLYINLTHEPSSLLSFHLGWKVNNQDIDLKNSSKFGLTDQGDIVVKEAEPSDAGLYMAIVSMGNSCINILFNVFIECKLEHNVTKI